MTPSKRFRDAMDAGIRAQHAETEPAREPPGMVGPGTRDSLDLETLRSRRDEILHIAAIRGARNVRVFGSVARDEANADSDIDFLVDMEPGRTVLDLSELILDLQDTLGRRVDVVEIRRPSPHAEQILREAVAL